MIENKTFVKILKLTILKVGDFLQHIGKYRQTVSVFSVPVTWYELNADMMGQFEYV